MSKRTRRQIDAEKAEAMEDIRSTIAAEDFDFDGSDDGDHFGSELEFLLPKDPFATSAPGEHLAAIDRFARAADAYVEHALWSGNDPEKEEILRQIAAYWLRQSRAAAAP